MKPQSQPKRTFSRALGLIVITLLLPLWLPLLVLWAGFYLLSSIWLHLGVWLLWLPRSKRVLFVYSDSPTWQTYIEAQILPIIREQAIILNWSQRRTWPRRFSLAVAAFKHFGGWREFNPMAVVFLPLRRAKVFRFLQPFREFKHGKPDSLATTLREFFQYAGFQSPRPNA